MTIIGSLTTFFAATTALVQTDLKRVIAYSTCSQLGYMITACGLSAYNASIFHLSNHAFFKALLFLSAGSVIHAMNNEQDMRKMGGLINLLPFTYSMILIGSLALMGFPFLSGFYSKDVILETAYATYSISGHFAFWLGSLSAFFTSFYSIRLIFLTFLNEVNSSKIIIQGVHDAPILMALPMTLLSFFSIFIGYFTKDIFVGLGTPFWGNSLSILSSNYLTYIEIEFLPFYIKILPVIFSTFGTIFSIIYYNFFYNTFNVLKNYTIIYYIYNFLNKKWYFDKMYNEFLIQNFISFGYNFTYKSQDRGFLETFGPHGLFLSINSISRRLNKIQTGFPYHFPLFIFVGFCLIIFILFNSFLYFEILLILYIYFQAINKKNNYLILSNSKNMQKNQKIFNRHYSTLKQHLYKKNILIKKNLIFISIRFLPGGGRLPRSTSMGEVLPKIMKEVPELLGATVEAPKIPFKNHFRSFVDVDGKDIIYITAAGVTIISGVGGLGHLAYKNIEFPEAYDLEGCAEESKNLSNKLLNPPKENIFFHEQQHVKLYTDRIVSKYYYLYETPFVRYASPKRIKEILAAMIYINDEINYYETAPFLSEKNRDFTLNVLYEQKKHLNKVKEQLAFDYPPKIVVTPLPDTDLSLSRFIE
jgi:NADH-ubiquinone oxidoreductase chain 5